ncbi:uncharacterized protein [Diadema setosum]|uniref:uncharacterized protein n=1 Tax=Diadema setosum TaxID=31175 RepID=UPI003B3A2EB0
MNTGTRAAMETNTTSSGDENASLPPEENNRPEKEEEEDLEKGDGQEPEEVVAERISLCVCSGSGQNSVQALLTYLLTDGKMKPYVGRAEFMDLPYNDLDSFCPDWKDYNAVILCHSIHNRRFAITNVVDALYDEFLPKARNHFGPQKVFVIVHDFHWPVSNQKELYDTFKGAQPATFENAKWVYVCGKLDNLIEMSVDDAQAFLDAIRFVHTQPALDQSPSLAQRCLDYFISIKDWILSLIDYVRAFSGNHQQSAVCEKTGLETDCKDMEAELASASEEGTVM